MGFLFMAILFYKTIRRHDLTTGYSMLIWFNVGKLYFMSLKTIICLMDMWPLYNRAYGQIVLVLSNNFLPYKKNAVCSRLCDLLPL